MTGTDIRVITDCTVRLVAASMIKADMVYVLDGRGANQDVMKSFSENTAADFIPEAAGRVCYDSFEKSRPGGNSAYIAHIKEVGHGSVLEHSVFSFVFEGISRSLSHELVRHRAGWSYSQLSQRFHDESDCGFACPPAILALKDKPVGQGCEAYDLWANSCYDAASSYETLAGHLSRLGLERKQAREAARSVLPNCVETRIFATTNARALRHFIELRASRHADAEIRRLANRVLDAVQDEAPHLFGDYRRVPLPDGSFEAETDFKKV